MSRTSPSGEMTDEQIYLGRHASGFCLLRTAVSYEQWSALGGQNRMAIWTTETRHFVDLFVLALGRIG
jgi:hypothetical protein